MIKTLQERMSEDVAEGKLTKLTKSFLQEFYAESCKVSDFFCSKTSSLTLAQVNTIKNESL